MHSASSAARTPCYYAGERVILSTMRLIGSPVWRPVTWKNGQGAVFSHRRMLSDRDTLDREVEGKDSTMQREPAPRELEWSKERWYLTLPWINPGDSRSTHMATHHVSLRRACPALGWTVDSIARRSEARTATLAQAERTRSN